MLAMTTAPIRSDWVGRAIDGRYTLRRWLGGSDWSDVFLTELPGRPDQKAALKLIPADAPRAQEKLAAWAAAKTLSHPHLIRLLDSGRCKVDAAELLYVVTEYAEENLAEILPERPLTAEETGEMLVPVLDALAFLHASGLVHGHLKPSNILVADDQLKLSCDRIVAADVASPAADVWPLGVVLVEALTQHPPVWDSLTGIDPIVPRSVPQPFFDIAQACLRADPARRCTLEEIRARLDGVSIAPKVATGDPGGQAASRGSGKRGLAWAAGILVLLASLGLVMRSHWAEPGLSGSDKRADSSSSPGGQAATKPRASISKPSPIRGRVSGSAANRPEQVPSGGSPDDSAVLERVMPEVLPAAQASIHGEFDVEIRVTVGSDGKVSEAAFESEGPSRYFSKQALEASRHWRFKPAQMSGENVRSVWLLEYRFTESGVEITPTQISP